MQEPELGEQTREWGFKHHAMTELDRDADEYINETKYEDLAKEVQQIKNELSLYQDYGYRRKFKCRWYDHKYFQKICNVLNVEEDVLDFELMYTIIKRKIIRMEDEVSRLRKIYY